jgi:hypothetical protein
MPRNPAFTITPDEVTAHEQYDIASWRVGDGPKLFFPVESITDQIGNRIIRHKRPYRAGAKLDNSGAEPRSWTLAVIFTNNLNEPGLSQNGLDLFPDVYRLMQQSFDSQETGDLVIPGLGPVRAKAETMTSVETFEELDTARVSLVFTQDNEEALDRALIRPPTARATSQRLAEQTVFTAQAAGGWDGDLNGLIEFAAEVENLLLAPGRATNSVETQVRRNRRAIERIGEAQLQLAKDVGLDTDQPRGSGSERSALLLGDRQAQAMGERSQGRPKTLAWKVDVERTNIFEVAARFDQDAEELMELNDSRLANPFSLQRDQVVLVFKTRPRV